MSGNPFRRTQPSPASELDNGQQLTSVATTGVNRKKKRVTIQTPPRSPEDLNTNPIETLVQGQISTPPPVFNSDSNSVLASFLPSESEMHYSSAFNVRSQAPTTSFADPPILRAPSNPFQRTLASKEAELGQRGEGQTEAGLGDKPDGTPRHNGRPTFDVDTFKDILLGNVPAASVVVPKKTEAYIPQTFDHEYQNRSTNTGRTTSQPPPALFENDSADSTDEDEGENGNRKWSQSTHQRPQEVVSPVIPKTLQGSSYPETVSFASFDESFPAHGAKRLSFSSSGSSNKEFRASSIEADDDRYQLQFKHSTYYSNLPILDDEVRQLKVGASEIPVTAQVPDKPIQKRIPPPLPSARRQHLTVAPGASSKPGASTPFTGNVTEGSVSSKTTSRPPVPPPSRRGQATPPASSPHVNPAQLAQTLNGAPIANESRIMPPPPPRRNSSKSGTPSARTPSTASRTSLSTSESVSVPVTNSATNAAPVPPPPRRTLGSSSRNSIDGPPNSLSNRRPGAIDYRRGSGQSFDSERSLSVSSLAQVDEPGENDPQGTPIAAKARERDILADMTAFQAEVDALRAAQGR